MLIKPFRLRVGVVSPEDGSLDLVNELMRSTITTANEAMCSFYVPLLTPIAFMLFLDSSNTRESMKLSFTYGSNLIEDEFVLGENAVRVYGNGASRSGFEGRDFELLASEESMQIRLMASSSRRILATFHYKHLEPSEAPFELNLTEIDYSNETSLPCLKKASGAVNGIAKQDTNPIRAQKRTVEAVDIDSDDSDERILPATPKKASRGKYGFIPLNSESNLYVADNSTRQSSSTSLHFSPLTLPRRQGNILKSFSPSKKTCSPNLNRSISNVKAEKFELKPMPKFEPSPSVQLLKDSQKKVASMDGQIESDEIELQSLEEKRQVKLSRAKSNYEKALVKADREYTADRARIEEQIEQAMTKREEELKKQEWLQTKAMENVEVIELSDDSASNCASNDDDEDEDDVDD